MYSWYNTEKHNVQRHIPFHGSSLDQQKSSFPQRYVKCKILKRICCFKQQLIAYKRYSIMCNLALQSSWWEVLSFLEGAVFYLCFSSPFLRQPEDSMFAANDDSPLRRHLQLMVWMFVSKCNLWTSSCFEIFYDPRLQMDLEYWAQSLAWDFRL